VVWGEQPESLWGAHEWISLPLGVRADLLDVASNAGLGQPVIDDLAAAFLDRRARDRDRSVLSEASAPQPAAAPAAATTPFLERGELSARPETPVTLMDHRKDPRVPTQQGDSMTTAGRFAFQLPRLHR
jgi:hypothetical protein